VTHTSQLVVETGMAAPSQDERMVPSSQAKLDELFLCDPSLFDLT